MLLVEACAPGPLPPGLASPTPTTRAVGTVTCRLPVFNWAWVTSGSSSSVVGQNGFVDLSTGTFAPDSNAQFDYDQSSARYQSQQLPVLKGDGSGFYDAAVGRWVPAPAQHVLPDGSAYVYEVELPDPHAYQIHLVEVATGADRVVYQMPYDNGYSVVAFQREGIYVQPILHKSGLPGGLWLYDIATSTLKAIPNASTGTWQSVVDGAAWGGAGGTAGNTLTRLNVETGQTTTWFSHTVQGAVFEGYGYGVSLLGFDDASHPLVEVFPPGNGSPNPNQPGEPEVWLVNAPGQATKLSGISLRADAALSPGLSDPHGLWLVGADGIYLYTDAGFRRAAPLAPAPSSNYALEGTCA